jgi:Poly-beta-hydroxyalkanoate depolymerase
MMGGPIDTREGPTSVNDLAKDHLMSWFERNMIYSVRSAIRVTFAAFTQGFSSTQVLSP